MCGVAAVSFLNGQVLVVVTEVSGSVHGASQAAAVVELELAGDLAVVLGNYAEVRGSVVEQADLCAVNDVELTGNGVAVQIDLHALLRSDTGSNILGQLDVAILAYQINRCVEGNDLVANGDLSVVADQQQVAVCQIDRSAFLRCGEASCLSLSEGAVCELVVVGRSHADLGTVKSLHSHLATGDHQILDLNAVSEDDALSSVAVEACATAGSLVLVQVVGCAVIDLCVASQLQSTVVVVTDITTPTGLTAIDLSVAADSDHGSCAGEVDVAATLLHILSRGNTVVDLTALDVNLSAVGGVNVTAAGAGSFAIRDGAVVNDELGIRTDGNCAANRSLTAFDAAAVHGEYAMDVSISLDMDCAALNGCAAANDLTAVHSYGAFAGDLNGTANTIAVCSQASGDKTTVDD